MGNKLPTYNHDNKSYEELLHELCKMYKHTAEVYQDPASYYKLGTAVTSGWVCECVDMMMMIPHLLLFYHIPY